MTTPATIVPADMDALCRMAYTKNPPKDNYKQLSHALTFIRFKMASFVYTDIVIQVYNILRKYLVLTNNRAVIEDMDMRILYQKCVDVHDICEEVASLRQQHGNRYTKITVPGYEQAPFTTFQQVINAVMNAHDTNIASLEGQLQLFADNWGLKSTNEQHLIAQYANNCIDNIYMKLNNNIALIRWMFAPPEPTSPTDKIREDKGFSTFMMDTIWMDVDRYRKRNHNRDLLCDISFKEFDSKRIVSEPNGTDSYIAITHPTCECNYEHLVEFFQTKNTVTSKIASSLKQVRLRRKFLLLRYAYSKVPVDVPKDVHARVMFYFSATKAIYHMSTYISTTEENYTIQLWNKQYNPFAVFQPCCLENNSVVFNVRKQTLPAQVVMYPNDRAKWRHLLNQLLLGALQDIERTSDMAIPNLLQRIYKKLVSDAVDHSIDMIVMIHMSKESFVDDLCVALIMEYVRHKLPSYGNIPPKEGAIRSYDHDNHTAVFSLSAMTTQGTAAVAWVKDFFSVNGEYCFNIKEKEEWIQPAVSQLVFVPPVASQPFSFGY
jgi:hypothetical protein